MTDKTTAGRLSLIFCGVASLSDNGADFHVQGEPNATWDLHTLQQMRAITMSNMEFVDLKAITSDPRFSPDSMAASW